MATAKSNSNSNSAFSSTEGSTKATHWVNLSVTIGDVVYPLAGLGLNPESSKVHSMLLDELSKADNMAVLLGDIIKGGQAYITVVGQKSKPEPEGEFKLG